MGFRRAFIACLLATGAVAAVACGMVSGNDGSSDAGVSDAGGAADVFARADAFVGPPIDAGAPRVEAGIVTVLVVDPTGAPIADASVTFVDPSDAQVVIATNDDGVARAIIQNGGSVIAPGAFVEDVAGGDLIHVGPGPTQGYVQGSVPMPAELDASTITAAFGDCSLPILPTQDPVQRDQVAVSSAYGLPINSNVSQLTVQPPTGGDLLHCVAPSGRVGGSFIARDPSGAPLAIALAPTALSATDAGPPTNIAVTDFSTVTLGTASFSGAIPSSFDSIESRVDFPFETTRYPGEHRAMTLGDAGVPSFSFVMPPAMLPRTMINQTALYALTTYQPPDCPGRRVSMHVHRGAAAASITEDVGTFLPAIVDAMNDPEGPSPGGFAAPLPIDAIEYCNGHVSPLAKGATKLPQTCAPNGAAPFAIVIASPMLPYALARQYPSALADPDTLLATILSSEPDVDLYFTFWIYSCEG